MLNNVRERLTLWYVGALALVLAAFSIAFYALLTHSLHTRIDAGLRALIEVSIRSLTNDAEEGQSYQSAAQSTATELATPEQSLLIYDASGNLLAENHPAESFKPRLPDFNSLPADGTHLFTVTEQDNGDEQHRIAVHKVQIPPLNRPYIILASQSFEAVEDELAALREPLLAAGLVALLLAGLGGWFLARKSLSPVVAMASSARRISAENLGQQLPVANPRDELGQLATTFNELLARLHIAFAQQRRFMADASHELRTPLSVMDVTAGVTLKKSQRGETEYREALQIIAEQTQRLSRIVKDMFLLARADAGHYPLQQQPLYLNDLIEEVARAGHQLAADSSVILVVESLSEASFYGDEALLRQMLLNLVDNAIKHTPPGGRVCLSLTQTAQDYVLTVSDTGVGIPVEAQAHIFERFYRVETGHPHTERGGRTSAGLGLAIAQWIAQAHQGSLALTHSNGQGSTFVTKLPRSPQS
jgi:two-component system, OmpR family, sensor kinase